MKRTTTAVLAGTAALALAAGAVVPAGAAPAPSAAVNTGDRAFGLTDSGRLVRFSLDAASATKTIGPITRLDGDTELVGIDFRVQNRRLYGVGDQGGVYSSRAPAVPPARSASSPWPWRAPTSAWTSTRPPTGSGSSATPARTSATT